MINFYLLTVVCVAFLLMPSTSVGDILSHYYFFPYVASTLPANQPSWPGENDWQAIPGLEVDPVDPTIAADKDFFGTIDDPAASIADDGDYLYFRLQLATTTKITAYGTPFGNDVFFIMVDDLDTSQIIDVGFAWDVQNAQSIDKHGLELLVPIAAYTEETTWSEVQFDDVDGSNGQKYAPDFNALSGTFNANGTDGYIRSTQYLDAEGAAGNVTKSYLDFAISWAYLTGTYGDPAKTVTGLTRDDELRFAFATISTGTDHTALSAAADLIGAGTGDAIVLYGLPGSTVPEPGTGLIMVVGVVLSLGRWCRRSMRCR